jgi:hypothetical protein
VTETPPGPVCTEGAAEDGGVVVAGDDEFVYIWAAAKLMPRRVWRRRSRSVLLVMEVNMFVGLWEKARCSALSNAVCRCGLRSS